MPSQPPSLNQHHAHIHTYTHHHPILKKPPTFNALGGPLLHKRLQAATSILLFPASIILSPRDTMQASRAAGFYTVWASMVSADKNKKPPNILAAPSSPSSEMLRVLQMKHRPKIWGSKRHAEPKAFGFRHATLSPATFSPGALALI